MNEPKPPIPAAERKDAPQTVPEAAPAPAQEQRLDAAMEVVAEAPVERVPQQETPKPAAAEASRGDALPAVRAEAPKVAIDDPALMKVERVMEADLWDVYVSLPEPFRTQFKKAGEDTARALRMMVVAAHIRASKIHDLVHKWLKKIPGVNEWFLLQESKIKTDQLVRLATWLLQKGHII